MIFFNNSLPHLLNIEAAWENPDSSYYKMPMVEIFLTEISDPTFGVPTYFEKQEFIKAGYQLDENNQFKFADGSYFVFNDKNNTLKCFVK